MANTKDTANDKTKGVDAEVEPQAGEGGQAGAKRTGRFTFLKFNLPRKTLMFVVAPAALVLALGLGVYFFLFSSGDEAAVAGGAHGDGQVAHGEGANGGGSPHPVFFEVPDILVNVTTGENKPAFLKLSVSLELEGAEEAARAAIEPVMPRIVDQLQTYLRELRVEDLTGSAAVFRLKEEMLRRVNLAIEPMTVKDVLFREMIIQ